MKVEFVLCPIVAYCFPIPLPFIRQKQKTKVNPHSALSGCNPESKWYGFLLSHFNTLFTVLYRIAVVILLYVALASDLGTIKPQNRITCHSAYLLPVNRYGELLQHPRGALFFSFWPGYLKSKPLMVSLLRSSIPF